MREIEKSRAQNLRNVMLLKPRPLTPDPWPSVYLRRIWLRCEPSFSLWKSETEKANSPRPTSPSLASTRMSRVRNGQRWVEIPSSALLTRTICKNAPILFKLRFDRFFWPALPLDHITNWARERAEQNRTPSNRGPRVFYLFNLSVKESRQESRRL